MADTYEDVFDAAYGWSIKNQPDVIADEATELLNVTDRSLSAIYTIAAGFNPTFFGASADITGDGTKWDEPADAGLIFYIEDGSGNEVILSRVDEQDVAPEKPTVYHLARSLYPASGGTGPDPSTSGGDTLTLYYAIEPPAPTAITDSLPSSWDDNHDDLLILQVAQYLALKDGREGEITALQNEINKALNRFIRRLESYHSGIVSRFGERTKANSQSVVSARQLLSGALGEG